MSKKRSYLACVSVRFESDYVIKTARCIAEDDARARLSVASVVTSIPTTEQLEALEHLHTIARESGASMTVLYNDKNPVLAVVDYIKRQKITHVIAGMPKSGESEGDFITLLRSVLPKVDIILIPRTAVVSSDVSSGLFW